MTCNLRHPMVLRHPVCRSRILASKPRLSVLAAGWVKEEAQENKEKEMDQGRKRERETKR